MKLKNPAAQFNEYLLSHPKYGMSKKKSVPAPKRNGKNTGLTEEQKLRIAQDEHERIEFGNNYRMLKKYVGEKKRGFMKFRI